MRLRHRFARFGHAVGEAVEQAEGAAEHHVAARGDYEPAGMTVPGS
jgi:hypothetical protein